MKDRHLFVSLNSNSWGSAAIARTIADELSAMGDQVVSFFHAGISSVMAGGDYRCEALPEHMGPLVSVVLDNLKAELNPTTIVLADYFANANFFYRMGVVYTPFHKLRGTSRERIAMNIFERRGCTVQNKASGTCDEDKFAGTVGCMSLSIGVPARTRLRSRDHRKDGDRKGVVHG